MKKNQMLKNALSSALSYGLLLVFSIVSSKLILVSYGSETNGLLSSVNQLFSYIALLEAGIGTSTISALYQPLANNDTVSISNVLSASRWHFRSSTKWYFFCVIIISILWPLLLDTEISYLTICGIIFFQGISGVITYWYTSTAVNYLLASGRNYVNNRIHLASTILTYILKIVICISSIDIVFISVSMVMVNLLKCLIYHQYLKKRCPECFVKTNPDKFLLKQRYAFLLHELSGVIFANTDIIMLSVFCSLRDASVYAVYALILTALRTIIGQIFNSTNYILGNSYSLDKSNYAKMHDRYNGIYTCSVFIIFTTAYWLILPFLALYTHGITDANYLDATLPILFILIELLSACRVVDGQLIKIALHAKQTVVRSLIEAVINIIVSLILVQHFGIYGVLLGTIAALLYRTNDIIIYTNIRLLQRSPAKEYLLYFTNFTLFMLLIWVRDKINIPPISYINWIGQAALVLLALAAVYTTVNLILNRILKMKLSSSK